MHDVEVSAGYRKGQSAMETLLFELCTNLGYCLNPDDRARLQRMATGDVDAFAAAVLAAECLLEPYDRSEWRNVRLLVARHFTRMR